jgi:hypothetical protein
MPDNMTMNVNVDILPFGTVRATDRVYFEVSSETERETITAPATTAACESVPASLPYLLR